MKKMLFSFLATLLISSLSFANTNEIKEIDTYETIKTLTSTQEIVEDEMTICIEVNRTYEQISEYVTVVTITYRCTEYPGIGHNNSTAYIDAE